MNDLQSAAIQFKPPTKASQDSEDGAQISSNKDEPLAGPAVSAVSSDSSTDHRPPANDGHHDPRQRNIYLGLLAFSLLNALTGLTLILVWMFNYRPVTGIGISDKGQLSNLHPVLMFTFMVSLNMYSVLLYRTHFDRPKQKLKWTHAILSGANIVMSLLGVAAMYKAHLLSGLANFYSLHSWIGALTNGFYLTQFLFGFIAFLKPGLTQQCRAQLMPWHRMAGAMLLVLAATAAITGITELVIFQDKDGVYQKFTPITFIANVAGVSIVLMTATSIYLLTAPQYARPAKSEEEAPQKR